MTLPELSAAHALALRFHETYERLAPSFGYETRTETRAFDPDSPNGRLMIAVCGELSRTGQLVERESVAGVVELLDDLETEADLCRNEGADDIAALLDRAIAALTAIKGDT